MTEKFLFEFSFNYSNWNVHSSSVVIEEMVAGNACKLKRVFMFIYAMEINYYVYWVLWKLSNRTELVYLYKCFYLFNVKIYFVISVWKDKCKEQIF